MLYMVEIETGIVIAMRKGQKNEKEAGIGPLKHFLIPYLLGRAASVLPVVQKDQKFNKKRQKRRRLGELYHRRKSMQMLFNQTYDKRGRVCSVTRLGQISPLCQSYQSLCIFTRYLIFGKTLNLLCANFHCCKWPNDAKNIYPSGHTARDPF